MKFSSVTFSSRPILPVPCRLWLRLRLLCDGMGCDMVMGVSNERGKGTSARGEGGTASPRPSQQTENTPFFLLLLLLAAVRVYACIDLELMQRRTQQTQTEIDTLNLR